MPTTIEALLDLGRHILAKAYGQGVLESIRLARADYKGGRVKAHEEVFGV